jgi:two-component sensor histidine kinase
MMQSTPDLSAAELVLRLRQQELVVDFGRFSMRTDDLQTILDQACVIAADGLDAQFAKIIEYDRQAGDFLVRAGIGWHAGVVGHARLGSDLASPAGYAFKTGQSVISNHLADESRFRTPALLADHGIHSAINVLIGEDTGARFGVLEVDSTRRSDFSRHDLVFLDALANTLADALEKQKRLDLAVDGEAFARGVLEASPDCVKIMRLDGQIEQVNDNGLAMLEIDDPATLIGAFWPSLWPETERAKVIASMAVARDGGQGRFQAFCPTRKGTEKWWDVVIAPIAHPAPTEPGGTPTPLRRGGQSRLVSISRDITDLVRHAESKDTLLREKDLLMQEVHHRVKNSLQMVQNLLSLQSRASSDDATSALLDQSAARVHTIAAIHDRLYRTGAALEVDIPDYLGGLIEDLQEALSSGATGRQINLEAEHAVWAASDVPTIGLVLTELVTNALKYGSGTVSVSFRQPADDAASLIVADEGTRLAADFDPAKSRGLGMRIVLGLLRGRNGHLEIDRSVPYTCFRAVLSPATPT